jgi:hypothetical protein
MSLINEAKKSIEQDFKNEKIRQVKAILLTKENYEKYLLNVNKLISLIEEAKTRDEVLNIVRKQYSYNDNVEI